MDVDSPQRRALTRAIDRRTILRGVGAAGVLGAGLGSAACTGPDERNPRLPDPNAQTTVAKSAVPEGSGVIIDAFIVTQPTAGEFRAYSSACPHQGCVIDQIDSEKITCPCHGSLFSTADGSMMRGPATTGLTEATVTDNGDDLTITA